ncbi:MAG: prephenate dehydratase [Bacteroidaceae bacterium]|nr:prephenate dehydratase [Bacteroidaceae bacterium]
MKRIAIQGIEGSFHDLAAHQYFENEEVQLICCSTFEQVFSELRNDPTVIGLVAIENTIAGSLLHNYELLRDSGATIVGEHKLRIKHSFLCLPDDDWADIQEVHSHPVALMQCRDFLEAHPSLKVVEASDTAGAARTIAQGQKHGHAAIGSAGLAELYGLKVLEQGIETNKHNFTRFLVVAQPSRANLLRNIMQTDKASLVFALPHEEGSLSHVLSVLSFYKLNLTKIQSLPIIGREWEYLFYVDILFKDYTRYSQGIDAIRPLTSDLKILGEYIHGKESI